MDLVLVGHNKPCYQINDYLWGYSRILLWYSEFYQQYQRSEFDYVEHFTLIISHLLSNCINAGNNQHREYQRNAFLSLIYLLTFREFDSQFCTLESKEYQIAKKVLDKFQSYPVKLKAISADKSLNEYFEELLNRNSSLEAIRGILKAD